MLMVKFPVQHPGNTYGTGPFFLRSSPALLYSCWSYACSSGSGNRACFSLALALFEEPQSQEEPSRLEPSQLENVDRLTPPPRLAPLFPAQDPAPALPAAQEGQTGRLIGKVLNETGEPVAEAQLRVGDEEQFPLIKTGPNGGFEIQLEGAGTQKLTVWHPEYERLETEVWLEPGLTTPVDVVLMTPLVPQPRTRLGVIGVGGLDTTSQLGQRLATEAVRLGLVPDSEVVVPLDNRRLQPILQKAGYPLYEVFEWDRRKPEVISQFFDYLGLKAIIVTRVDILNRPASVSEVQLKSHSRLELWTFDEQGNLQVNVIGEASRETTEPNDLNGAEVGQLFQLQVTDMAQEVEQRWQESNPLSAYFDPENPQLAPQPSQLDTSVELIIPPSADPAPSPPADSDPPEEAASPPAAEPETAPLPDPTPTPDQAEATAPQSQDPLASP
ncbi:MAG: carboxypeptidase regulatory-like domain-containing protein [Synechococcaceae cyanobacterium SM2_3_1]|nr:carboxypeptidase regulatory-like domain-containing protein [Synechococcaceae cyanobacterium SM2_3_1]